MINIILVKFISNPFIPVEDMHNPVDMVNRLGRSTSWRNDLQSGNENLQNAAALHNNVV
jgi:hypothetical protein